MSALPARRPAPFAAARAEFGALEAFLGSPEACRLTHSELERELEQRGRELLRQLLQAHLEVRGPGEAAGPVTGADGVDRGQARLQTRGLETVFGEVEVARVGYGAAGVASLHPLDAELNLPPEHYSLEVRRRVADEAATGAGGKFCLAAAAVDDNGHAEGEFVTAARSCALAEMVEILVEKRVT